MKDYQGESIENPQFMRDDVNGLERKNFFKRSDGFVRGYTPHKKCITIEKMDPLAKGRDRISNVLVVWVARQPTVKSPMVKSPMVKAPMVVIGWYKNATVLREFRLNQVYQFWAKHEDAKLLDIGDRTLEVPMGRGVMGHQAKLWYASVKNNATESFREELTQLVESHPNTSSVVASESVEPVLADAVWKSRVEDTAIRVITEHFEAKNYAVRSVESENLGYDLLASKKGSRLLIEVKGRSYATGEYRMLNVNVSANEYKFLKFCRRNSPHQYRLAIVSVDGDLVPTGKFICKYSYQRNRWVVEGRSDAELKITPRVEATISLAV